MRFFCGKGTHVCSEKYSWRQGSLEPCKTSHTEIKVSLKYFISVCIYAGFIISLTSAMLLTSFMVGVHGSCQFSGGQGPLRNASWQTLNHHPPLYSTAQWPLFHWSLSRSTVQNDAPFRLAPGWPPLIILSPEIYKKHTYCCPNFISVLQLKNNLNIGVLNGLGHLRWYRIIDPF